MKKREAQGKHIKFAVLATDIAFFTIKESELLMRLVTVNRPPFYASAIGLPGGLIRPSETAVEAAQRLLKDKASINPHKVYMEQLYTFSDVKRDPRGRVVSVAYIALIPWDHLLPSEKETTSDTWWSPLTEVPKLAYDHDEMLNMAMARLRSRITYTSIISKLLPREFTLTDLEQAYKSISRIKLDKRNFRKKILKLNLIVAVSDKRTRGAHRPAQLYRFSSEEIKEVEII